jgi:hypothetical protein
MQGLRSLTFLIIATVVFDGKEKVGIYGFMFTKLS